MLFTAKIILNFLLRITVKHCSVNSIKFEFGNNGFFSGFLWQTIFKIFQIWAEYAILERIPPYISFLKHLQAINPLFVAITINS